jgi:hypothetical protein
VSARARPGHMSAAGWRTELKRERKDDDEGSVNAPTAILFLEMTLSHTLEESHELA